MSLKVSQFCEQETENEYSAPTLAMLLKLLGCFELELVKIIEKFMNPDHFQFSFCSESFISEYEIHEKSLYECNRIKIETNCFYFINPFGKCIEFVFKKIIHMLSEEEQQYYSNWGQDIPVDIIKYTCERVERVDWDIHESEETIRYIPIIPSEERSQIVLSPGCVEQREDISSFDLNVSVLSESGCIDGLELVKFTGTEETSINITCFNPDREIDKSVEKHINPIVFLDVDDLEEKYWESIFELGRITSISRDVLKGKYSSLSRLHQVIRLDAELTELKSK
jgi:hypothetical protein